MSSRFSSEVKSYMEKAEQAVAAAEKLILDGYYDFAASRAYYAAFYAASPRNRYLRAKSYMMVLERLCIAPQADWFSFVDLSTANE